jgi:hypothetical protein
MATQLQVEQKPAAMQTPSDSPFCNLPTEMKVNVFAFIRTKTDKRVVCLVSREWRALMVPMLWETLASTFRPTPSKSLAALLQPHSGILPHVKRVHVRSGNSPIAAVCDSNVKATLQCLSTALPKQALRSFTSDLTLPASLLVQLLQSQPQLRNLSTRVKNPESDEPDELASVGGAPWLASSLTQLATLNVHVPSQSTLENYESRFLLENSTKITTLGLIGQGGSTSAEVISRTVLDVPVAHDQGLIRTLGLTQLGFGGLCFATYSTTMFKSINFSALVTLRITSCRRVTPFLKALTVLYSESPCKLARLDVIIRAQRGNTHDAAMQATESLLQCVPPLEYIYVDIGGDRLVSTACLLRHGPTLRTLWLATGRTETPEHLSSEDLNALIDGCPHLEQLATNLCPIDMGSIQCVGSDFTLHHNRNLPRTELEAMLDTIARQKKLHTLRVLSLPTIDYGESPNPNATNRVAIPATTVGTTQMIMHKFAAHMMRYLANRGSRLKLLAIAPFLRHLEADRADKDEDGHQWPKYYYLRGRNIDARGVGTVTALPLPYAALEMTESSIIWEY